MVIEALEGGKERRPANATSKGRGQTNIRWELDFCLN
jgi:hypothetical protein